MTTNDIALGAAIISVISMLISWRSFSYAKKSYRIVEKDHNEKKLEIKPYLIEAIDWKKNSEKFTSFAVSYTNEASESNTLITINLELECYDNNGVMNKINLSPEPEINPVGLTQNHEKLPMPLNIPPKSTISGWLTFKLPVTPKNNLRIDTYRVVGTTSKKHKVILESFIHRMVMDEQ